MQTLSKIETLGSYQNVEIVFLEEEENGFEISAFNKSVYLNWISTYGSYATVGKQQQNIYHSVSDFPHMLYHTHTLNKQFLNNALLEVLTLLLFLLHIWHSTHMATIFLALTPDFFKFNTRVQPWFSNCQTLQEKYKCWLTKSS